MLSNYVRMAVSQLSENSFSILSQFAGISINGKLLVETSLSDDKTDYNKGPYNVLQLFRENRWIHTGAVIEAYLGVDQASIISIVDVLKKVG
ncbi:unnamed protein product [Schistosoma bovis]|nr:unnamed protein product [Schistosoma bovis]